MKAHLWFMALTATAAAMSSTPAQANVVDYWPVRFLDEQLASRPDVAGKAQDLQMPVPYFGGVTPADIATPNYERAQVSLYSDVYRVIQALVEGRSLEFPPTSALQPPGCPQNAGFHVNQLPKGKTSFVCSIRIGRYESARQNWENSCDEVINPDAYIYRRGPAVFNTGDMSHLEGLIGTAVEPLSKMGVPAAFRGESAYHEFKIILRKIRLENLRKALKARQDQLGSLIDGLKNTSDCVKVTETPHQVWLERLRGIRDENNRMLDFLGQVEAEGRALAAQDRLRVERSGRKRVDLPMPWLTDRERELIAMTLGGVYWRMRGGGMMDDPKGTQTTRYYFTQKPMGVLAELGGGSEAGGLGLDIFIRLFKPWGHYMDMGQEPNQEGDEYYDLVAMTERGLYQVETAMGSLGNMGYNNDALQIGGMMMGPCYYVSLKELRHLLVFPTAQLPYREFIDGFPAWGETCSGAVISLGMMKSLLAGKN